MPIQAILLIVAAALIHATWNALSKHAGGGGVFVWCSSWISAAWLTPVALIFYWDDLFALNALQWGVIAASGTLHMVYSIQLQRAYAVADLSVVYPLARGSAPLITLLGAVLLLGERPTMIAYCGVAGIVLGAFVIGGGDRLLRQKTLSPKAVTGVYQGLLTGAMIASYTLVDGYGVKFLLIAPIVLDWLGNVMRCALLTPNVIHKREQMRPLWARAKWHIIGVGLLSPLSYILVLSALKYAPISYVAPARELSMLVGALIGAKLLSEGDAKRRMTGALCIAIGVGLIALG